MHQQPGAAERRLTVDRIHAERPHAMERLFSGLQLIGTGRSGADHALADAVHLVHATAEARMRFELDAVRQVHRLRGDVVDCGEAVIAERTEIWTAAEQSFA